MPDIAARGYANPDVLVSTDWVAAHLNDPNVRLVESNEDTLLYASGHVPGAVHVDWTHDLNDQVRRDYVGRDAFNALMSRIGATRDTTVVFYGDKNNWWACYAFWVFQLFGHTNAKVMDGGRVKWEKENRELTRDVPTLPGDDLRRARAQRRGDPRVPRRGAGARAGEGPARRRAQPGGVRRHAPAHARLPERGRAPRRPHSRREEHPVGAAINPDDGTFKTAAELKALYEEQNALAPGAETIAYCRIGERSSHTWFALTYLLGFEKVRNYDGSWTEWGNMVGVPIEK